MVIQLVFYLLFSMMCLVLLSSLLIISCIFFKSKAEQKSLNVQKLPDIEAAEPEKDAKLRQEYNKVQWTPIYQLNGNVDITKSIERHPKSAPEFNPPPFNPDNKVYIMESIKVWLVPNVDPCRGIYDQDESTEHSPISESSTASQNSTS